MTEVKAERSREDSIMAALPWYTSQNLVITPIHFPIPNPADPLRGVCSCGRPYEVDENGVLQKPDTEEAANDPNALCPSAGKHPIRNGFLTDRTKQARTPEEAKELWQDQAWNIGVLTGQRAGLVVFDVDVRADGLASMTKLTEKLSEIAPEWELAATLTYLTSGKSGRGYHMYFRADEDDTQLWRELREMGERILPGIEIKWKSGMVVASPSLHASGQKYTLSKVTEIATLDRARLAQLRAAVRVVNGKSADLAPAPAGGGWAALSAAAAHMNASTGAALGGDLSWEEAPKDSTDNPGYWSRQLTYLLMTGRPARQFGPGEHHDSLKSLIGATAKIIFSLDTFCREVADTYSARERTDPHWVPAIFGSLVYDIDNAVTIPRPWQITDRENLRGMMTYSMKAELRSHGYHV